MPCAPLEEAVEKAGLPDDPKQVILIAGVDAGTCVLARDHTHRVRYGAGRWRTQRSKSKGNVQFV
jgi:hypothetical protein